MNIDQLRYFACVARLGNVSAAARELYMSQPSLSRSIARLEAEVGTLLLNHRKGSLELTPAGREFLGCCDTVLTELDGCLAQIAPAAGASSVTVACQIDGFIGPVLREFSLSNPGVSVHEVPFAPENLGSLLVGERDSLAICSTEPADVRIAFTELRRVPYGAVVRAGSPLAARPLLSVRDLRDEPLILDTSRMDRALLHERLGGRDAGPRITHELSDTRLVLDMVIAGAGISIMPLAIKHMVDEDARLRSELAVVALEDFGDAVVGIARARSARPSSKVDALVACIEHRVGELG